MAGRGKLVLVVGPSGSGKDTLMEAAEAAFPDLPTLVTCTTRTPRPGETNGVEYHFFSREEFERRVSEGEFLEWAEYGGNKYGTLKASVDQALDAGEVIMTDMEVQGVRLVRERLAPEELITIFVDAGGWDVLVKRIMARAPMSESELAKRYERYLDEVTFREEATYVVNNPDGAADAAKEAFIDIIRTIRHTVASF